MEVSSGIIHLELMLSLWNTYSKFYTGCVCVCGIQIENEVLYFFLGGGREYLRHVKVHGHILHKFTEDSYGSLTSQK